MLVALATLIPTAAWAGPRSDEKADCWIPSPAAPAAGSVTPWRLRLDGAPEILVTSNRYQLLEQEPALCTEVLPGLAVYTRDAPDVAAYLSSVDRAARGVVLIGGEEVPWALDLHDWSLLAGCESGNRWHIVDASGQFHGGLQLAIAGAERLSVAEQIELARGKLDREGPGAWPVCSRRIGWR
jgi:hypothetical protein